MKLDKIYHHVAGASIVLSAFFTSRVLLEAPTWAAILTGTLLCLAIADTKECFDEAAPTKHTKDWLDAAATKAGGYYATIVLVLAQGAAL